MNTTDILTRAIYLFDEYDREIRVQAGAEVNVECLPMAGGYEIWTRDEDTNTAYSTYIDDCDYECYFA